MSKQERNWQRFWNFMLLYFYALIVPATIIGAIYRGDFPIQLVILAIGLPFMKKSSGVSPEETCVCLTIRPGSG